MLSSFRRTLRELRSNASGNATLLMAIGMPALIGASGLAVDTAQWYMWKRELQYAADQAALAGAWAKASSESSVQATYTTRARQEYNANVSKVVTFDATPSVSIANYNGGTNNSVVVSVSATKALPFSSFLTSDDMTVTVRSQASFNAGTSFSVCMLAVHPTADQAFKLGGSVTGSSTCGSGSLSNDPNAALKEAGNTSVPLGQLVAVGGIDQGFANNGTIHEDQQGLYDPYASLTTPSSSGSTNQTYVCPTYTGGGTTYNRDGYTRSTTSYRYYRGSNSNNWVEQTSYPNTGIGFLGGTITDVNFTDQAATAATTTGWQTATPTVAGTPFNAGGTGSNTVWRVPQTSTQDYNSNIDVIVTPGNDGIARPMPGIYTEINITCQTIFSPGIYFISGTLDFGQNQTVTGAGVMFVITSSAGATHINSNSNIDISGIAPTTLMTDYGYTATEAAKFGGMLFWDKESTSDFIMNGNATVKMDGALYMPSRNAKFNGNSTLSGKCIMIAAQTLTFLGNEELTNFCVPSNSSAMSIGGGTPTVKLVA